MIAKWLYRLALFGMAILILASLFTAFASSNSVPGTHVGRWTQAINANALKPAACAALNLTNIVACPAGGGNCTGTNANELILGSMNVDNIRGRGGNDCILGGGGNDTINGGNGTDVCIGGPGTDTFTACETQIQ
jgi:Ca2+-binding RTX toxin-like protein